MPPQHTTRSIGTPYSRNPLDDRARAEGGRLDQRAVDLRARRVQRLAEDQAGELRIDEHRAVAVVPVEREQARRARRDRRRFARQLRRAARRRPRRYPRPTT